MAPQESKENKLLSSRAKEEGKIIQKSLITLNLQVALFRDLLLDVGSPRDGPNLREKLRRVRLDVVEATLRTNRLILPSIKDCSIDGTIVDTTHLVCLYLLARLLQVELEKCLQLVTNLPITDMEHYLESKSKKTGSAGIGPILSKMALCNSLPDWNTEEVSCVKRNKNEVLSAVEDMAEHLPKEDPGKAMQGLTCHDVDIKTWTMVRKRRKVGRFNSLFCCSRGT